MLKILKKDDRFDKCGSKKFVVIFFQQNYYELKNLNFLCDDTKNNRFFHKKIIKSYISMIIERLVNAFNEFVKKIKRIDITVFDINVY